MTRSLTLVKALVLALTWMSSATFGALADDAELERNPKVVISLRRGETKELQLCWDSGTGRVPVYFVSGEPFNAVDRVSK